jgi:hypothetical protein
MVRKPKLESHAHDAAPELPRDPFQDMKTFGAAKREKAAKIQEAAAVETPFLQTARGLFISAAKLVRRGYLLDALAVYDHITDLAAKPALTLHAPESAVRELVIEAVLKKTIALNALNRRNEATTLFKEIEHRYGSEALFRAFNRLEIPEGIDYFKKKPKTALKEEGYLDAHLQKYLTGKKIRPEKQAEAAAIIARVVDEIQDADRPQWGDQDNPAELAILTAPKFLKKIWADKISPDGVVRNDDIRDKGLVEAVRQYINGRKGKDDLGDAEGLNIIRSPRGRRKYLALSNS